MKKVAWIFFGIVTAFHAAVASVIGLLYGWAYLIVVLVLLGGSQVFFLLIYRGRYNSPLKALIYPTALVLFYNLFRIRDACWIPWNGLNCSGSGGLWLIDTLPEFILLSALMLGQYKLFQLASRTNEPT